MRPLPEMGFEEHVAILAQYARGDVGLAVDGEDADFR
jgi:hypothetical protein